MNRILRDLAPHPSKRISELAATMPGVVDLTVGTPPFGPPHAFRRRLVDLVAHNADDVTPEDLYAHSRGVPELRQAIARLYASAYGQDLDPDHQILVTNGATGALVAAVLAATDPGDKVLLADPSYLIYAPMVQLLDRRVVRIPTTADEGFLVDVDRLTEPEARGARMLLVNSPANPTAAVYDADLLKRLCAFARRNGLRIVHDEVLDCFVDPGEHSPVLAVDAGGVGVCVNSLSKRFGMTGWRLGWLVADHDFVEQAAKGHTFLNLAVGHAVQKAAAAALVDDAAETEVHRHARAIRSTGERFLNDLRRVPGLVAPAVKGGFYAFVDVRRYAELHDLSRSGIGSVSAAVAEHMLRVAGIAVVNGNAFGPCGEGYVRMSFARPKPVLDRAIERLLGAPAGAEKGMLWRETRQQKPLD